MENKHVKGDDKPIQPQASLIKKVGVAILKLVIFVFGLIFLIGLYMVVHEYSEGLMDVSWVEIFLMAGLIALFTRHIKICKNNNVNFIEMIRRPFTFVGWFRAISFFIFILLFIMRNDDSEEILDLFTQPFSLIDTFFGFALMYVSILVGTPKKNHLPMREKSDCRGGGVMRFLKYLFLFIAINSSSLHAEISYKEVQDLVQSCAEAVAIYDRKDEEPHSFTALTTSLSEALSAGYCRGVLEQYHRSRRYNACKHWLDHAREISTKTSFNQSIERFLDETCN